MCKNSFGRQQHKKYDGKTEDVLAEWVMDGKLAAGSTVAVNVGGGRTWTGTVTGSFYKKNPFNLALPIKRTRRQSPLDFEPTKDYKTL